MRGMEIRNKATAQQQQQRTYKKHVVHITLETSYSLRRTAGGIYSTMYEA